MIGLLLEVAREHDEILEEPAPQALFHGFGESSLDFLFRAWTDSDYDRTLAIRSDLALATHRKLREAGVHDSVPAARPPPRERLARGAERARARRAVARREVTPLAPLFVGRLDLWMTIARGIAASSPGAG